MCRLVLDGVPGLDLILELVCVPSVSQVPRARTRVWRRAVWLPGKERQVNTQRSQEVLSTDHVCAGLLPQSFHLVSRNTHMQVKKKKKGLHPWNFIPIGGVLWLKSSSPSPTASKRYRQKELQIKRVYMHCWAQIINEGTISFYSGISDVLEYFPSFQPLI